MDEEYDDPDLKPCDECGKKTHFIFTYEGEEEDGSEDQKLCRDCISRR